MMSDCIGAAEIFSNILDRTVEGYIRIGSMKNCVRKKVRAHRHVWEQCFGPIPLGLLVLHKCDNPPCVNPEHLFLGTHGDNMRDMVAKGRGVDNRGSRHGVSKLTEDQAREIRQSIELGSVIASRFGVSKATVSMIRSRKTWGHVE